MSAPNDGRLAVCRHYISTMQLDPRRMSAFPFCILS